MGSSASKSRTVTIDNDAPAGIIDVSEDVVSRLKTGLVRERASQPLEQHPTTSAASQPIPHVVYHGEPTITAMQVRKEKEEELFANDQYWSKRLMAQEAEFLKNSKIMEKEFSETVDDVKKKFQQTSPVHQLPPCQDLKSKIVDCYIRNPSETLKCATEVKQFLDCINLSRLNTIDTKQAAPAPHKQ